MSISFGEGGENQKSSKLSVSAMLQYRNTELLDCCLQHLSMQFLIRFATQSIYTVLRVYQHMNQMQRLTKKKKKEVQNPSTLQCRNQQTEGSTNPNKNNS